MEYKNEFTREQINELNAIIAEVYTREPPKSRIDEIAEEAREKLRDYLFVKDGQESSVVDDIIKSAIMKDREGREAGR